MASQPVLNIPIPNGEPAVSLSNNWNDQPTDHSWSRYPIFPRGSRGSVLDSSDTRWCNPLDKARTYAAEAKTIDVDSVIDISKAFRAKVIAGKSVNTLQEWEGLVQSVGGDVFTARLRDLTKPNAKEELGEISFDGIDPNDYARVKPGAIFHLIVGYTRRSGSQRLETFTYFRRHLPSGLAQAREVVDLLDALEGDAD